MRRLVGVTEAHVLATYYVALAVMSDDPVAFLKEMTLE